MAYFYDSDRRIRPAVVRTVDQRMGNYWPPGDEGIDVPAEFESVTVTVPIAAGLPENVNGTVR